MPPPSPPPPSPPPSPPPAVFITLNDGENYEIDVTHHAGYDVYIKGAIIKPGDHVAFVRKDLAIDGVDDDLGTGAGANASANCDQANHGLLPVSGEKGDDTRPDYGGEVRGECLPSASDCDPDTCAVYPESDPDYHEGCRYATEFRLSGVNDTLHPGRHPFDEPLAIGAGAPAAPPWFNSLDDNHTDNGLVPSQVAGVGSFSETYEETGTYYLCYMQTRDPTIPGYGSFTFLK
jgi:hypothetical protein